MTAQADRGWNLFRRCDRQWVLQYRPAAGKWSDTRVPRKHRTEHAAERYARTWMHEYGKQRGERPVADEADDERPTIRGLVDRWLELCDRNPKCSPATRIQHKTVMTVHVLAYPEIADVPIA